jgi:hypothetical protein
MATIDPDEKRLIANALREAERQTFPKPRRWPWAVAAGVIVLLLSVGGPAAGRSSSPTKASSTC